MANVELEVTPTRYSSVESDAGFINWQRTRAEFDVNVYLNGVEQKNVDTVDAAEGWLRRCKLDSDGDIYVIQIDGEDQVATEVVQGDVKIVLKKRDS